MDGATYSTASVLGLPIAAVTMDAAVDMCSSAIEARRPLLVGVVNAAKLVNMRRTPKLDRAVRTADVIFADGMSVVWASRLLGRPLPERVTGIDLMDHLLRRANERRHRVYFLGATDEVLAEFVRCVRRDYPDAVIAGHRNGYFDGDQEEQIARDIASAKPDMLFAAMTSPKKEEFLAQWSNVMQVPVCHGVGGAFDVVAGKVKRAPQFWQRWGLEWLYRVLQEPRRMWRRYLVTNTIFCWLLLREMVSGELPAPHASGGTAE